MNKIFKLKKGSHGLKVVSEIAKSHSGEKAVTNGFGGFGSAFFARLGLGGDTSHGSFSFGKVALSLAAAVALSPLMVSQAEALVLCRTGSGALVLSTTCDTYTEVTTDPIAFNLGTASGNRAIAWSYGTANATNATAWGNGTAGADRATAWSYGQASSAQSTAWGDGRASAYRSTAWGGGQASSENSTAWGSGQAKGTQSTAWGNGTAGADKATAWSYGQANGTQSTAWGGGEANGTQSTAWGGGKAIGSSSTALGDGAVARGGLALLHLVKVKRLVAIVLLLTEPQPRELILWLGEIPELLR